MAGKALIFSAPSGSGKTTIVKHLLKNNPDLGFSISASTRDKRGRTEQDGKDYHFLTPEDFKKKIDKDEFIEWEEVYAGNFYGTLKSEIHRVWKEGKNVIFDVDVEGGLNIKKYFGEHALAVFVKPPSVTVLEERLRYRSTETEETLRMRVDKAIHDLEYENRFECVLLNEKLEDALQKAESLINEFLKK